MIWLEEYHINNYVKKYDARSEGRYLNPPKIRSDFQVSDRVIILPQGRYKQQILQMSYKLIGRWADIIEISDHNPHEIAGRFCRLKFLDGKILGSYVREINLKKKTKTLDISDNHGEEYL